LKIQKRGYGRAVYMRHENGMISVYGHLESYSSDLGLEQIYQQKVAQNGTKYVGDIFLEPPVTVQRGTIIAYSGESGAGLPHLHLELRRGESVPVNPLTNGLEDTLDPVAPSFQAAYLYPASGEFPIDGELDTQVVRFRKEDSGYMGDHAPVVRGDFFLSVSAYDAALRPYHRNPYQIGYTIDGRRQAHQVTFDQFSYTEPEHFGLIYDLGKPGPAYFEYPIFLGNPFGVTVPFAGGDSGISISALTPGMHHIQINATDTNGNASAAFLDFIVNQPPEVQIDEVISDAADLVIKLRITDPDWQKTAPSQFAGEVEFSVDEGKTFLPFPSVTMDLEGGPDAARLICRTPLADFNAKRILVKIRGYDGIEYSPYTVVAIQGFSPPVLEQPRRAPQGEITLRKYADAIKLEFNTNELITYPLELNDGSSRRLLNSWNLTLYSAFVPLRAAGETLTLNLSNSQQIQIPLHRIRPEAGGVIRGDQFELDVDAGGLYGATFIWPDTLPAYQARHLYPVGSLLQLNPRGLPFKKDARLSFRYPASTPHPERLSIYRWSRARQKWESLPSVVDRSKHNLTTKISYLELYALLYDNVAPVIRHIFPKRNSSTTNDTPRLAAFVSDYGMDIDDDKVRFFIDGIPHAADYDPDRNLATLKVEQPLHKGYHRFWVEAYDWGGNKTVSQRVTFRIR
jgi:hypothetical protein